ncbi:uncharacterized protein LOC110189977 [Drosophila serrata]|uniref:uncharacterized protein LOC110189977 n=1 Tax=Drosophila serrata TaxID=7274 RepID=UPI000A1D2692|nr:uncharacterized protein LOC110189977 [Drosophila serrata]
MWSDILRTLFGPSNVPHKIQKLLQYRFVFAFILGCLLDYLMLGIFLGFELFQVRKPLDSLVETLDWTLFSLYASTMMIIIRAGMAGYGLVLWHMHYAYPRCNGTLMKRIIYEFPIHFSLLFTIMSVAISTSWLYASFVKPAEGYYHLLGCLSGICYFKTHHNLTLQRFPFPIVRLSLLESILQMWSLFNRSQIEAFKPTVIFTLLFWPYMENIFKGLKVVIVEPRIFLRGWLVNALILAKLNIAREIYGLIMQRQLPLIIELRCQDIGEDICLQSLIMEYITQLLWREEEEEQPLEDKNTSYGLSLSISNALDSTHLYGFRMLAARDFYAEMSGNLWNKLFTLEDMKNTNDYWEELREVIYKIINDFVEQMDSCLDTAPRAQICDLLKRKTGIRPLIKPEAKRPQGLCCCHSIPQRRPIDSFVCYLKDHFRKQFFLISVHVFKSFPVIPNMYDSLFEIDKLAKLNQALECGEPLVWILQGLVCICARSLKKDTFGILQRDIPWVFKVLIKVEGKLLAAAEVPVQTERGNEKLCSSHKLLMLATNRCLFRMLKTFGPHLNFIVNEQPLWENLKRRMENLNVFQENF